MIWEIIWSLLWPATGTIGLYLMLSLMDLWSHVAGIFQSLALGVTLVATCHALWKNVRTVKWPSLQDVLRRVEIVSGLTHRPLTTLDDDLIQQSASQDTRSLWGTHRTRQRDALEDLRGDTPNSDLPARDPYALRAHIALLLIVSFFFAGDDWKNRLSLALSPSFSLTSSGSLEVTAWVNPPTFTGVPPLFLTKERTGQGPISVPEGSELVVRIAEPRGRPFLKRPGGGDRITASAEDGENYEIEHGLTEAGTYRLKDRGRTLANWSFAIIPDATPYVEFDETPYETEDNHLGFSYVLHDDYGIDRARLHVALEEETALEDDDGLTREGGSFDVEIALPGSAPRDVSERADLDLTDHPFAGLDVTGEIRVQDLGGKVAQSQTVRFQLPERDFFEPLALALVEQRRNLMRDPTDWAYVMRAMEALTLAPERFFDDLTVYMGMRTAYWQLDRVMPQERSQVMPTAELLWDLALHVEDGNLALAERELKAIAKALMEALARGAPMDEIQRLLQRYQEALERYLAALAEEALAGAEPGDTPPGADGPSITDQDLMDLLKAIEDLAKTGDTSSARELLAQLQRMLENMTMSAGGGGMNGPESELADQIEGLSDLIGKERALMDETLRRSGEEGEGQEGVEGLESDQGDLRGELEGVDPGELGGEAAGSALDEARGAMEEAEGALGRGDGDHALNAQRRAIDKMREAAEGMAEELMKSMQARGAQGTGGGQVDPLGRSEGSGGSGLGDHIKVPEERDLQRAREILKELQKRAADPDRPKLELDYLERLLKRF